MRYEVTWMYYVDDWEYGGQEQAFESEQYLTLDEALKVYENKKTRIDIKHVRLVVILDENINR